MSRGCPGVVSAGNGGAAGEAEGRFPSPESSGRSPRGNTSFHGVLRREGRGWETLASGIRVGRMKRQSEIQEPLAVE